MRNGPSLLAQVATYLENYFLAERASRLDPRAPERGLSKGKSRGLAEEGTKSGRQSRPAIRLPNYRSLTTQTPAAWGTYGDVGLFPMELAQGMQSNLDPGTPGRAQDPVSPVVR